MGERTSSQIALTIPGRVRIHRVQVVGTLNGRMSKRKRTGMHRGVGHHLAVEQAVLPGKVRRQSDSTRY